MSQYPITFDPTTGEFFRDGVRCDYPHGDGYRCVFFEGKRALAHLVAYRLMLGVFPPAGMEIDHKDRNPSNNVWLNLRVVTSAQNKMNRRMQKNNHCGEKNVCCGSSGRGGVFRWMIGISFGGKRFKWLASHKLSAILAARLIRRELHQEFACGISRAGLQILPQLAKGNK